MQLLTPNACEVMAPSLQSVKSIVHARLQPAKVQNSHLRAIKYLVRLKEYQRHFAADPDQGLAQLMMKCRAITKALERLGSKTVPSFLDRPQSSTNLQRETDPRDTSRPSGPKPRLKIVPNTRRASLLKHCIIVASLFQKACCFVVPRVNNWEKKHKEPPHKYFQI